MKLVILDNYAMEKGDLNFEPFYTLAEKVESYGYLSRAEQLRVIGDADFLIINKTRVDEELITACPRLKWIGVIATGTDNIDLALCRKNNISVANVPGYSGTSVAQLTFALILQLCQSPSAFYKSVQDGYWRTEIPKSYGIMPQTELYQKTIGVIGYGDIGRNVIKIASAFGMNILCNCRTKRQSTDEVTFTDLDTLLRESDIVTLHCPATEETEGIISAKAVEKMKRGAILINTSRGALVDEDAVARALYSGKLAGFGADVLKQEPMCADSPFKTTPNTIITPHIAWATKESLDRLIKIVYTNLESFINGNAQNIVN